jgi:hypothetical protein
MQSIGPYFCAKPRVRLRVVLGCSQYAASRVLAGELARAEGSTDEVVAKEELNLIRLAEDASSTERSHVINAGNEKPKSADSCIGFTIISHIATELLGPTCTCGSEAMMLLI